VRAEDEGDGVYDINKVGLDDADAVECQRSLPSSPGFRSARGRNR
jgi:hypothetical protein